MLEIPEFSLNPQSKGRLHSIGVLTSGGDAPGMNAAIRAVVRFGLAHGAQVFGIQKGYSGLLEEQISPLSAGSVANIIQRGGTILKTDRCLAFYEKKTRARAAQILRSWGIEGLVVIGGDGSFTGASLLEKEQKFPCIGVPGTIDNDIFGTDDTIGFDTAVNTAIQAIDRVRDTASSHDRIFLVEVMGRNSGFIGVQVGLGGGAETIVVPEFPATLSQICTKLERGLTRGKTSSILVVAEGKKPGLSTEMAKSLEKKGFSTKVCILGHTQRGGSPSAHDRMLASVLGASATGFLMSGKRNAMVGVQKGRVVLVPFKQVIGRRKDVSASLHRLAEVLAS